MRKKPQPLNLAISRRESKPYDRLVSRKKQSTVRRLYLTVKGGIYGIVASILLLLASVAYGFMTHDLAYIIWGGIACILLLPFLLATGFGIRATGIRMKATLERIERLPLDEGLPLSESLVRASEQPVEEYLLRGASSGQEPFQEQLLRAVRKSED